MSEIKEVPIDDNSIPHEVNKHKRRIEKEDKKYPLMEYFLSNKSLDDCSKECQRQVKELRNCDLIV